jgi:hypothetical protein
MSSVQPIAGAGLTAFTARRPDTSTRTAGDAARAASTDANARSSAGFATARVDPAKQTPAVPEALDIKNIRRANNYADAFGMPVDPSQDIGAEQAASFFARYGKAVDQVIDRLYGAEFKAIDVKV